MKYSVVALSMAAAVAARPAFTNLSFDVVEGEPFTLEFTGCEGGCTINLKNGEENDLQDVQQLTSNAEGGSFTFSLESVPSDTYTFEIVNNDSGEDNYSQQFQFEGDAAAPTSAEPTSAEPTTETQTLTSTVPETTSSEPTSTTEESSSTETSTVAETTTVTSPSASTTASPTESTTASEDSTSTTDGAETSQTSEIPAPEDAAMTLGSPMTFVVAAVAGLLMIN